MPLWVNVGRSDSTSLCESVEADKQLINRIIIIRLWCVSFIIFEACSSAIFQIVLLKNVGVGP